MAAQRLELGEYHVGVLLLIIADQLIQVTCLGSSAAPTQSSVKCTEILRTIFNTDDQRKQNFSKFEKVSPSTSVMYSSTETRTILKIANATKQGNGGCSNERNGATCRRFVDKYSSFYLKVGT